MTGREYQSLAKRTINATLEHDNQLANGVMGLCGEAGECADLVKKHLYQGHALNDSKLFEELGDVCWYVAATCEAQGYDLDEVLAANIDKLKARYPEGFSSECSINREEYRLTRDDLNAAGVPFPSVRVMLAACELEYHAGINILTYPDEYRVYAMIVNEKLVDIQKFLSALRGTNIEMAVSVKNIGGNE